MSAKAQNISVLYAVVLAAINWNWSRQVQGLNYSTTFNGDGAGIAALISGILLIFLAVRLFRILRTLLNERILVPREVKLFTWAPLLCLAPLMFNCYYTYSSSNGPSTITERIGYGSDQSIVLLVVAALLMIAFQTYCTLKKYLDDAGLGAFVGREFRRPA
jgi:integral membrane sensor domain MASE1